MDLYTLIPEVIKRKSEEEFGPTATSILEEITDIIEAEYSVVRDEIVELVQLINPDTCELSYLKYIAGLLGESPNPDWTELQQREFLKNLTSYFKIKGTHHNVDLRAQLDYGDTLELIEDWKTQVYETTDYSIEETPAYPIKSARLDVLACDTACETTGEFMDPSDAEAYLDGLGEVLPIHVLVRKNFETEEQIDEMIVTDSGIGCVSCETMCEDNCELGYEVWEGSVVTGDFEDDFPQAEDEIVAITTCVYTCETVCQDCCQCWGYRVVPEIRGEVYQAWDGSFDVRMRDIIPEEHTCTNFCEAACEAGANQTDSVATVDGYLEFIHHIYYMGYMPGTSYWIYRFYTETEEDYRGKYGFKEELYWASSAESCDGDELTDSEREAVCSATCEAGGCQAFCEDNCESGCEVFCEGGGCETSCEGVCMLDCQSYCQQSGVEGACAACETDSQAESDYLIIEGGEV